METVALGAPDDPKEFFRSIIATPVPLFYPLAAPHAQIRSPFPDPLFSVSQRIPGMTPRWCSMPVSLICRVHAMATVPYRIHDLPPATVALRGGFNYTLLELEDLATVLR